MVKFIKVDDRYYNVERIKCIDKEWGNNGYYYIIRIDEFTITTKESVGEHSPLRQYDLMDINTTYYDD